MYVADVNVFQYSLCVRHAWVRHQRRAGVETIKPVTSQFKAVLIPHTVIPVCGICCTDAGELILCPFASRKNLTYGHRRGLGIVA